MLKGFTRKFKPLEILTEEHVEAIHRATLDVLWGTGLRIEHKRALEIYEENGCKVDYDSMRVRIPPGLVEECLRRSPSTFRIKSRDPNDNLILGGNTTYFACFSGMQTADVGIWEPRIATRKENYDGITVMDALDNVHMWSAYCPYFGFEGVPPCMSIPESVAGKLRNSTKTQWSGYSADCELYNIRMGEAAGHEMVGHCLSAPPLTYYADAIECLLRYVEAGLPAVIVGGCIYGGTAPATIAGATVTNNAELIGPIVLAQLVKPGSRIWVGDFTFPQNMRAGAPAFGAIGISLQQVMFNQIWRKYGVPTQEAASPSTSKAIDFQNAYERSIYAFSAAISGGNLVMLHGGISSELTYHPVMAILDDDIAGMVGRFIEGVKVNDETLALDLIHEVGPIPGHYLNTAHTREWWKKEQFVPKAADRLTYPEWMKAGKKDCIAYAKERMEEILATHKVSVPLTPEQEQAIEDILKEAREDYRKKGLITDEEWSAYMKSLESPNYPYA